ncbi:hypothetical protein [Halobaculum sp. P14]|uniref:hypothetical protein n=1 Tax=Halobaculum sp. P14 TaxID=3421638 RepID=UPI003EBBD5C4
MRSNSTPVPDCLAGDDERTVLACPECDEPRLKVRGTSTWSDPEHSYVCEGCGWRGDEGVERPPKTAAGGNPSELGQKLLAANPDDYPQPTDHDDQLVTDGGVDIPDGVDASTVERAVELFDDVLSEPTTDGFEEVQPE